MMALQPLNASYARIDARFVRFLAVGLLNTAFGYGVFALLIWLTGLPIVSLIVATAIGIAFNFVTTGRVVFLSTRLSRLLPFVLGYGASLALNVALLKALLLMGLPAMVAQALCLPAVVVVSYLINARLVFRAA